MDSTTRRLRAFIALAEQRHFGKAARQVFVSQQALSKQIAVLEDEVGAPLVRRGKGPVELTAAGELFLVACRDALRTLDEAVSASQSEVGFIRVGLVVLGALELTELILDAFRQRRPGCELVLRQFPFADPSAGLSDRGSDLAILRLPVAVPGLRVQRLFVEPRVVALSSDHRLAAHRTVEVRELSQERLTASTSSDEAYRDFWALAEYRPSPVPSPIPVRSHAEELEVVASGRAVSITSACAARLTPHTGVRFIPIEDIPGTECALGWRADEETTLVREFVAGATEAIGQARSLVRSIEHPEF